MIEQIVIYATAHTGEILALAALLVAIATYWQATSSSRRAELVRAYEVLIKQAHVWVHTFEDTPSDLHQHIDLPPPYEESVAHVSALVTRNKVRDTYMYLNSCTLRLEMYRELSPEKYQSLITDLKVATFSLERAVETDLRPWHRRIVSSNEL